MICCLQLGFQKILYNYKIGLLARLVLYAAKNAWHIA
ncbi:hypothetical protein NEOC95_000661 [Neochlamydia sp. AcF95]|nr:hypothetical protein [Neochlamydia sp. AcF95]